MLSEGSDPTNPPKQTFELNLFKKNKKNKKMFLIAMINVTTTVVKTLVFVWLASHVLPYLSHRNVT